LAVADGNRTDGHLELLHNRGCLADPGLLPRFIDVVDHADSGGKLACCLKQLNGVLQASQIEQIGQRWAHDHVGRPYCCEGDLVKLGWRVDQAERDPKR